MALNSDAAPTSGASAVFLSYARQDGANAARRLAASLAEAGHAVWWDQRNLDPFRDFTAEIELAIEAAKVVLVAVTSGVRRADSFVRREIGYALALGKPIVPLIMDGTRPPIAVINLTYIDFCTQDWDTAIGELSARIRRADADVGQEVDPFHTYLAELYQGIVSFLEHTVRTPIALRLSAARLSAADDGMRNPHTIRQLFVARGLNWPDDQGKPDDVEQFINFGDAVQRFRGRVLLVGAPGAGKTTTLMSHARDAIAARLSDGTMPLPLVGLLATWAADSDTSLPKWLAGGYRNLDAEQVERVVRQGRALIFLDGLDELAANLEAAQRRDALARFVRAIPDNNSVLVTCRAEAARDSDVQSKLGGSVTLQPFSDAQVARHLAGIPELLAAVQADSDLRDMLATPLIMTLFAEAYGDLTESERQQLRELTSNPSELRDTIVERYARARYEWESRRTEHLTQHQALSFEQLLFHLGRLATENAGTYRKGAPDTVFRYRRGSFNAPNILIDADFRLALDDDRIQIGEFIELCRKTDLLIARTDGSMSFRHLLMRDSFAYRYSLRHLYDESVYSVLVEVANPAEVLAKCGRSRAVGPLVELLQDERQPPQMRECAANALGFTRDRSCVDVLIATLRSGLFVQRSAEALGRLGDARAFEPLVEALQSGGRDRMRGAAVGLGFLGDARAIPALRAAFYVREDDAFLCEKIINALCALGEAGTVALMEQIVSGLAQSDRSDMGAFVREHAASTLVARGDERIVDILIAALSDQDPLHRAIAAETLAHSGSERGVTALSQLLSDSEPIDRLLGKRVNEVITEALEEKERRKAPTKR